MPEERLVRFGFDLPFDLRKRAHIRAIQEGTNLGSVLRGFLEQFTEEASQEQAS